MRVAVLFDNFGPYHVARLNVASRVCDVLGIELAATSNEYAWERQASLRTFRSETLFDDRRSADMGRSQIRQQLHNVLEAFSPEAVAIPGWSSKLAIEALAWASHRRIPALAMSESTREDANRSHWKEAMKSRYVALCSCGIAGGSRHRDYLLELGMPADQIFLGYDVVDNDYFAQRAERAREGAAALRERYELPERYFLASNRFIEKKNLPRLIHTYAQYREKARHKAWDLVILGDGPIRPMLESLRGELRLERAVHLPGFKQYDELPIYYGLASAFIHASTVEQWGLVVNEAMASGLPVLVSERCGCAPDLVQNEINGWTFDPFSTREMVEAMSRMTQLNQQARREMGQASQRTIADWGPERFARGLCAATHKALEVGPLKSSVLDRALLSLMAQART